MIYISRLNAEKDNSGVPTSRLKKDENFIETHQLDGEHGALKDFISEFGTQKGLHIAVICSDYPNSDQIESLFGKKILGCNDSCNSCAEKRAVRISEIESARSKPSSAQKYYQEGCYWDCILLEASSILDVFQRVIKCLTVLGKETERANAQLDAMRKIEETFPESGIKPCLNAQYMGEFSNNMVSYHDTEQGYASIYLTFILQESFFKMFQISDLYFPVHIEYVVKGIVPPEQKLKEELRAKDEEIEQLKQQLQEYQRKEQAQQWRSGQEKLETSRATIYNPKVDKDIPIYSSTKSASTPIFKDEGYDVSTLITEHDNPKKTKKFNPENENTEVR